MLARDHEPFDILQAILDSAGDGVIVLDERRELTYFNPAAARILAMDPKQIDPAIWTNANGIYSVDRVTPFPPEANPLYRALAGESTTNVEMFVRHAGLPDGAFLRATSRPIFDSTKRLRGAVVTFRDVTDLRAVRMAAERLAVIDPLTNIANRRALDERLGELVAEAIRGRQVAVALIDLDRFKEINDAHGHQLGDEVLQAIASGLQQAIRQTDFVARYGGDEFCVLLTDVDEEAARQVARKLQDAIHAADARVRLNASVGICAYRRGSLDTAAALLHGADAALYYAKATGRARVVAYSDVPMPEAVLTAPETGASTAGLRPRRRPAPEELALAPPQRPTPTVPAELAAEASSHRVRRLPQASDMASQAR